MAIAPALVAGAIAACAGSAAPRGDDSRVTDRVAEARVSPKSIDDVLAAHTDSLMTLPGVVGTAIGLCDGERCIKVFLADSSAEVRRRIPARIETYRVSVEVTGPIRPRS